jgi:polynucleotide 5'-hydroxyl-kinase GRC3/NOL9
VAAAVHIPDDWQAAIERIGAERFARIAVIGATDTGKSSFVTALMLGDPGLELIDADPGQKLVGPPGTVSLGRLAGGRFDLGGFVFIGSTSSANIFLLTRACEALARASQRFVANSSGFVEKLGARLQAATIAALDADCIVALGDETALAPILDRHRERTIIALRPSPSATRKTSAARARLRQASFAAAIDGAGPLDLSDIAFEPAPPARIGLGGKHPVCSLADADGTDMAIGVLDAGHDGAVRVIARAPDRPAHVVRLGSMWAERREEGWRLIDTLHPSWVHDEPEG